MRYAAGIWDLPGLVWRKRYIYPGIVARLTPGLSSVVLPLLSWWGLFPSVESF